MPLSENKVRLTFSRSSAPSLALFGASAGIFFLYISDWKVTNTQIPIYGRKFEEMKRAAMIDKHGQKAVDEGTASDE
jgi:Ubiquinol-cytochrome C reductase complex, 6.4kD protein